MVEQMYLEETKEEEEQDNMGSSSNATDNDHHLNSLNCVPPAAPFCEDQKPDPDQLLRVDSYSLSSIVNTNTTSASTNDPSNRMNNNNNNNLHLQQSGQSIMGFGSVLNQLDYLSSSNYNVNQQADAAAGNNNINAVSLTLGLQQGDHGLAFTPAVYYPTDDHHLDNQHNCQPHHQYSLLDEDHQPHNLPYTNLIHGCSSS